ncbi:MAG TPA: YggT family protein [Vicinamibacterales bacterium]|jgi:uncharacterized protein YggT (Ycf19 family)|nr:YggT family protein [Vicinamibacterales bacterium]
MTYREDEPIDDTQVVERERVVERRADPPPANANVNVSSGAGTTYVDPGPGPLYYARRVIALLFGILFVLLILRIVLLLLGANEGNGIVDGIYSITEPFVAPFRGVFSMDVVRPVGRSVLDIAAVVALVGYILIELLILAILRLPNDRVPA